MPQFSASLSVDQGFNFRKDVSTPVGFIKTLSVNGKAMAADFEVKDPMNPTTGFKVVAVLSDTSWAVGATDAFYFSGQVSAPNRQDLQLMTYLDLTNVETLFKFDVYGYDPVAKKYFKAFHAGDVELKGILEKNGQDLNLSCSDMPSSEVQSPINYSFHIGVKPQPVEQNITLATADQKNVVKFWGVKQG
jgi:hypothetical protein